jgi:hypothetical protein
VEALSTSECDLQILNKHCAVTRRIDRFDNLLLSLSPPPSPSPSSPPPSLSVLKWLDRRAQSRSIL